MVENGNVMKLGEKHSRQEHMTSEKRRKKGVCLIENGEHNLLIVPERVSYSSSFYSPLSFI